MNPYQVGALRRRVRRHMTTRCRVEVPGTMVEDQWGGMEQGPPQVIYEGTCWLAPENVAASDLDTATGYITTSRYVAQLPYDVTIPQGLTKDQTLTVTESSDASMVGARFNVQLADLAEARLTRRLHLVLVENNGG